MNINFNTYDDFLNCLASFKDENYLKRNRIILNYDGEMLGIRKNIIDSISKNIIKTENDKRYIENFLKRETKTYEEKLIFAYLISNQKLNFNERVNSINQYLDFIDNWALCDAAACYFKFIKKDKDIYFEYFIKLSKSKNIWKIRFMYVIFLTYYLDDKYIDNVFKIVEAIKINEYYINMAKAWLISIAFIKNKDKTYEFLNNNNLDSFTINKSIQKIRESFRVENEDKDKILKFRKVGNVR